MVAFRLGASSVRKIDKIVIHHSASSRDTTVDQIRLWHQLRGWKDVGYHFVIRGDGKVEQTRLVEEPGIHAQDHNTSSIGICVVGDNTIHGMEWATVQIESLRFLLMGLPKVSVLGHRDLPGAATLCPGMDVRALLAERGKIMDMGQVAGIARAILSAFGGYLVGQGLMDQGTVEQVSGAVAVLVTAIWSFLAKRK